MKYYQIIKATSIIELQNLINKYINDGCQIQGGLSIENGVFYQAIINTSIKADDPKIQDILAKAKLGNTLDAIKEYSNYKKIGFQEAQKWIEENK
jgi:hypothetical protein